MTTTDRSTTTPQDAFHEAANVAKGYFAQPDTDWAIVLCLHQCFAKRQRFNRQSVEVFNYLLWRPRFQ